MSMAELLRPFGIDYAGGIVNVDGNERLYMRLLAKFPNDGNYASFVRCMEQGDLAGAKIHIHALKGLSANLAMTELNAACSRADSMLKGLQEPDNMGRIRECYEIVKAAIERHVAVTV